ncbi:MULTISPECIES: S-layer family protein [unclassified Moorena]|uniref:beta strand repeat-containing protein n=1 Tax=unclassified Moorena TaxID=2683338 RepID=UPI0013C68D25|nr:MULTISPECIES: S-layer family protein [unclassified Moorena]NEP32643.1 S-layer family protein [Moorena sp. SIO3B2]NES40175.1 S-layer family protein [Moorena sp. SIO2C4]
MKPPISRLVPATSVLLYSLVAATTALGQITPDNTLGNESSVVTPNVTVNGALADLIEGGAIRDSNLFHSFSDFNVAEFGRVYFANPGGIDNILSRVTGGNVSNILGTLGVLGNANLFLINPNGIFFGPNSRLDVGGSFFGSTADSVLFDNSFKFSATNPDAPPLLTIKGPLGLQYGSNPGTITNQLSFLRVPDGQTLGLIGGDVNIPGGFNIALDGRIELGSVGSNGVVKLIPTDSTFRLDYSGVEQFQDISLSEGALVDTSGIGGGSIQVQGSNVSLRDRSFVFADTRGSGSGGGIEVGASQLSLEGGSRITADVTGSGQGGDVSITTGELIVSDGAFVSASTFGEGDSGDLTLNVSSTVKVIGISADETFPSGLFAETFGSGNAQNLSITTGELIVSDGAFVSASTIGEGDSGTLTVNADSTQLIGTSADGRFASGLFTRTLGIGNGGELKITTGKLIVSDGALVSASTFGEGDGADLTVDASSVQLIGSSANGRFFSGLFTQTFGRGNGGELKITTGELIVSDGAFVSARTLGEGNGGNLTVDASSKIQLIGTSADARFISGLFTQTEGTKNAGDLKIATGELIVSDGAAVSARTLGEGDGGNLTVDASSKIQLIGTSADGRSRSGLFIQANREATGNAGDLLNITTDKLIISDGAEVSARSINKDSSAGTVDINANSIFLDNNGRITAETAGGDDSNIKLFSRDIRLLNESKIITEAQNTTTGGKIEIKTDTLVGLGDSDIIADADQGSGGRVEINAKGIFGLEFRDRLTPDNDITSTSERGSSFNGEVILNISQVDPTSGLNELPGILVDAEAILANDLCGFENNRIAGGSSFTIIGKGGLPPTPEDPVINAHRTVRWRTRPRLASNRQPLQAQASVRPRQDKKVIIEAQGWVIAKDGTIILTAQPFQGTPVEQILPNLDCHSGRGNREQGTGNRE